MQEKPLKGVKVIEMATFVAGPIAARLMADFGADVIKVEPPMGDMIRWNGASEGRSADLRENTTFDFENANKRDIALNLKDPVAKEAFIKMLKEADVFVTNWRMDALKRADLDYDHVKEINPKIVFATMSGYGFKGPDAKLPGYDFTSFFGRGGLLGTLYQKGESPFNCIPGLGDHQAGLVLLSGVLMALRNAEKTGKGDFVYTSLYHVAVYTQALMVMAAQYKDMGVPYPVNRRNNTNPFNVAYQCGDGKFMQLSIPPYEFLYNKVMETIGRPDLKDHPVYAKMATLLDGNHQCEVFDIIQTEFKKKDSKEWDKIVTEADLPHSVCYLWEDILEDPQAWENDIFYKMNYTTGNERALVRTPIFIEGVGLPDYKEAPQLGENGYEILKEYGYTEEQCKQMEENKQLIVDRRFIDK